MRSRGILVWVVIALVVAGCGLAPKQSSAPGVTVESGPATAAEPSAATPAPTPSPTPTPTKPKPKPKVTPTPKKPVTPVITCSGYDGKNLSRTTVKQYLTDAALQDEYAALDPARLPPELDGVRPIVRVPLTLLKAIAAQESGWQSACKAHDHMGFGTMQIQPGTPGGINDYFGESWDRMNPRDNIKIAAALLQQLTVHFGIVYFHSTFDLAHNAALRHAVVAAYNVGMGNVEANNKISIGPVGTTYYKAVDEQMQPTADCQHWG